MKKEVSPFVLIGAIVAVLALVGYFIYAGATGGKQGDGKANNVEASPPMPKGMERGANHIGSAP